MLCVSSQNLLFSTTIAYATHVAAEWNVHATVQFRCMPTTGLDGEHWDVRQFLSQQFIWFCLTIQELVVLGTCFTT